MESFDAPTPTSESVKLLYLDHYHRYCQLKAQGKQVSRKYVENHGSKLSEPDRTGTNYWQKLAAYCVRGNYDVERLIRAFFIWAKDFTTFGVLNHDGIFNSKVIPIYNLLKPSAELCLDELRRQQALVKNHVEKQDLLHGTEEVKAIRQIMSVEFSDYSPLFRCCALNAIGDSFAEWMLPACRQYRTAPDNYDKSWGKLIPESIRATGQQRTVANG